MKKFKVSEIIEMADKKYDLYGLDPDDPQFKQNLDTYSKQIRKYLKDKYHYPKLDPETHKLGYKNIDIEIANYIVDHGLKDYFIDRSNNRNLYRRAQELNQADLQHYEKDVYRFKVNNPAESLEEDERLFDKEKEDFLSFLQTQSDPVSLSDIRAKYPHLRYSLDQLDKALDKAKLNYVFETILKQNNVTFNQNEFIQDFFERNDQIDDSNIAYEEINAEYVKLNDKLSSLSSYIK